MLGFWCFVFGVESCEQMSRVEHSVSDNSLVDERAKPMIIVNHETRNTQNQTPSTNHQPRTTNHLLYAAAALHEIPRLIGSLDRNPFRPTFGSFDRQFWHYRTAAFPSEMYQEAVLPLALVYTHELPGNRWQGAPRLREWILAALQYSAKSAHADGSCDDYYPFERALGAAVFSLNAAAEACRLLKVVDPTILDSLVRRALWIVKHDESGKLTNHHALAALALERVGRWTGRDDLRAASLRKIQQLLGWQSSEGWFEEYGGADPGYQTVTIDCLAKLWRITGYEPLREPLDRAIAFARKFLHPDGSYAGEYGSRGTMHFYPHGFELLARESGDAAELADGFLSTLADGRQAQFADDRMYVHRLGNLIEAYLDWSPERPPLRNQPAVVAPEYLDHAQMLIDRRPQRHTIVSAARGGVVKHFVHDELVTTDTGLVVETADGRVAVSQSHDLGRDIRHGKDNSAKLTSVTVSGPLHWSRFETVTPLKQAILHLGMMTVGRWCRTLVRRVLQRRLITGRQHCPVHLERTIELRAGAPSLRIIDRITLQTPGVRVARMSISSDLESAYVAASGAYQDSLLEPWTPLDEYVDRLNRQREVIVVREWR